MCRKLVAEVENEISEQAFTQAWINNSDKPVILRLAESLYETWRTVPIALPVDGGFPGRSLPESTAGYSFGRGVYFNSSGEPSKTGNRAFPEACTREIFDKSFTTLESEAADKNVFWAGTWGGHIVMDYRRLLSLGITGIRSYISERRTKAYKEKLPVRSGFYEAEERTCDTIEMLARRYAMLARKAGQTKLADILERVPKESCQTWEEAIHAFWLVYMMDGVDSPGRFDQYMWTYYKAELDKGNHNEAFDLLERLWLAFESVRAWNLCVGGVDVDGCDASNELSIDILRLAVKYRQVAPDLTLRIHEGTPDSVWHLAAEALGKGNGMPAIYNDAVVVPALTNHGVSLRDARNYCMNGCNQIDIHGMSHMGLEDGELSLIKCLELALNDGFDPLKNKQLGPHTGRVKGFTTIDDVIDAFKTQASYFISMLTKISNRSQEIFSRTAPDPLRSLLVQGCLEKGLDIKSGGPVYNHGQILLQGIGNTADSLAAIENLVYLKKLITLPDLLKALQADWEGYDELRRIALRAPRYGNDDDRADRFAVIVVEHAMNELKKHKTFRGGYFGGGSSVYVRGIPFGSNVGATPDGRKARTPLADSVGPVQGRDTHGPTAAMLSVAKPDLTKAVSGYVLNMKFTRDIVDGAGREQFIGLLKGYFASGGQQVQVTVADTDELRKAQSEPDSYRSLIVRVGGYSDYFVNLDKVQQDEIISRTHHRQKAI